MRSRHEPKMSRNKLGGNVTKSKGKEYFMISVGIDVSKGKSTVCFFKLGGEVLVTPFEVAHTKGELNELADKINSYGEEARVVLENTGYYHWSVVKVLVERGIFVSAVNPLKMKRFCSQNIR